MNSKSNRSNTGYRGIHLRNRKGNVPEYNTEVKVKRSSNNWITFNIGNFRTLPEALIAREKFIKSLF